jgi:hypothetical protein
MTPIPIQLMGAKTIPTTQRAQRLTYPGSRFMLGCDAEKMVTKELVKRKGVGA